jgi:aminoglycoside 3-N-acetyltransferase
MSGKSHRVSSSQLITSLRGVGVEKGDIIHVQSSLPHIGPVGYGDSSDNILDFYLDAFEKVLGPNGTLLVHTPFEDYARYSQPFDIKQSPSRAGVLSECIRTQPGAVRSMHPIVSTAGIGRHASAICDGAHYEGFGYQSSWGRMHRMDVLFVTLGLDLRSGLSFAHYIESLYGVPYQYCKVYSTPVLSAGKNIEGTFTLRVRYLDFSIAYDLNRFQQRLIEGGAARSEACGRSVIQSVRASSAFEVGIGLLESDVYGFLASKPQFREGVIPSDGPTGSPGYIYDATAGQLPDRTTKAPPQPVVANFDSLRRRSLKQQLPIQESRSEHDER